MKRMVIIFLMLLAVLSCKEESFRIECATKDQGWVEFHNNTGIDMLVDVTWKDIKENEPIYLNVQDFGGADMITIFDHIPAGTAKVWYSTNNGRNWYWTTVEVLPCEKSYCIINEINQDENQSG